MINRIKWNFLFLGFQYHLSVFLLSLFSVIIKFSPSSNLINEKGILGIKPVIKKVIYFQNQMDVLYY
jgi:hypothetical protein